MTKKDTEDKCDELLSNTPKLNEEDCQHLDKEITLEELQEVVNSCGDSAPGPDGIPCKVYRKLWDILAPYLLEAWPSK